MTVHPIDPVQRQLFCPPVPKCGVRIHSSYRGADPLRDLYRLGAQALPSVGGCTVYLLWGKPAFSSEPLDLLYVGVSNDVRRRFAEHAGEKAWWPEVRMAELQHWPSRASALRHEARLIESGRPRCNRTGRAERTRLSNLRLLRDGVGSLADRWAVT